MLMQSIQKVWQAKQTDCHNLMPSLSLNNLIIGTTDYFWVLVFRYFDISKWVGGGLGSLIP